ncbi:MAG: alpha/beta hydrolase [Dehalococcoidia bacterium]
MSDEVRTLTLDIPAEDVTLEAILHLPAAAAPVPGVVVCHPHPQYGGDMNSNVVSALCQALVTRGIAALRFNFRGVGRSTGAYDDGRGEARDVATAIGVLAAREEINAERVGLVGYSFGAMMALAAADQRVQALGLVSPPLQGISRERLAALSMPLLMVTGDADHICPEAAFRELAATLTGEVEAEVVPGADHFWWSHERDLDALAGPFFARHLGHGGSGGGTPTRR